MKTLRRSRKATPRFVALNLVLASLILPVKAGVVLTLEYEGIPGNAVADLKAAPAFPNAPFAFSVLANGLTQPQNFSESFGMWTRGFVEAPQTGNYTFWLASDDDSELWLSTSAATNALVKIAENVGAVGYGAYTGKPSQKSVLIPLVAGNKYYFEMFHKDGTGGDHCEVAWTLPDATFQSPLPGANLWPYPVNSSDPAYPPQDKGAAILTDFLGTPVTTLPSLINVEEARPLEMTITAEASQPAYVQWYSNNVPIPNANLLSYRIPSVRLSQNGDVYSVAVTNSLGSNGVSTTLSVSADATAPTLVDALNLGNPSGIVTVVFSEAIDPVSGTNAGNYSLDNGASATSARLGSSPNTVLLKTSGLTVGPAFTLTVSGVKDFAATPNTIAASSPIAVEQSLNTWLRLDESTGTAAGDSSGNGRNGTLVSGAGPGFVGQVLRSVQFDGVDDHIRLPNGYADFTTGMTVALWARPTTAGLWARFIDLGNAAASDNILFARNGTSDAVTFEVYQAGVSAGKVTALGAIVSNSWRHFTATMDSSGSTIIYVNGVPAVTNSTGVPNVVTRTNDFFGRSNWAGDGYYGGRMDDVRIYNRVLSAAAVKALAAGAGADDTDPVLPAVGVVTTVPTTALHLSPPGVFTVTRAGSTTASLTVDYALSGTATNGVNYTNLSGSVVIPAGSNSAPVFVQPIDFSFPDVLRTVVLNVSSSTNYNIGDPDGGTITIANNNVAPAPSLATVGNPGILNVVDVWFASPVTTPSATNFANYVFSPPLTVTNATLGNRSLRVVLQTAESVAPGTLLTVQGVQDPGGSSISNQLSVRLLLTNSVNLVASAYHSPDNNRPACFVLATNGIADNVNNAGGFDTFNTTGTDFAGLLYGTSVEMYAVKVDLGNQFSDGGSWISQPKLYVLKSPVDTSGPAIGDRPEQETNYWVEVAAPMISGSLFSSTVDPTPSPNTPIVFDLSGLPANQRTGYGWAVGGATGDGTQTFISISELSAFGTPGNTPAMQLVATPGNLNVAAGQRAKLKVLTTYPVTYQWLFNGSDVGETKGYYGVPPVKPADNNATITAVLSYGGSVLTNLTANLTVIPRATAPVVRDATFGPSNAFIYVWFDESVDPTTAQNVANYTLNDPGISLVGAAQDNQGFRVSLNYTGTPTPGTNLTLTVTNIQDLSGNVLGLQVVPVIGLASPASRVVANAYQQTRATSLTRATNGIIANDANVTTWTTFGGSILLTDFVGLGYPQPQVLNAVVMNLGWQFGDGGDWSDQPRVFIQKTPLDTNQTAPENDTNNWIEVPAVLMSGNIFDPQIAVPANTTPLPNNTIAFDLSGLPIAQRTGYGWVIGGVRGNAIPGQARFVTVSELSGFGQAASTFTNSGPPEIALDIIPTSYAKQAGAALTLYTVVTGSQPLYYQWLHNGTNIADTTRITGAQSNVLVIREFLGGDGGTYQLTVTNALGSNASVVATVALATGLASLNGGTNWMLNGGATISNNVLQLVSGTSQARSAFLKDPYYIGAFRASFTYQDVGGGGADGSTFVLQNAAAGPAAVGGTGGSLGYATTVTPSVALCMNIFSNASGGIGYSFGANGVLNTPYKSTAPVNFASGEPISVKGYYDGTNLFVTFSNTVTAATFSTNATISIPAVLLTNRAYVGFTSGSGTIPSNQRITDFLFSSLPPLTITPTATNTIVFTWPTSVGNFVLQENSSVNAPAWSTLPAAIDFVSGLNQVIVPIPGGNRFYRLLLQ